jgi:fructokinase
MVVLTQGAGGVQLYRPDSPVVEVPSVQVEVIDTIGAGDAFGGGLLVALDSAGALGHGLVGLSSLDDAAWTAAVEFAASVASLTCTKQGAEPPTGAELAAFAARRPTSVGSAL